ncbi:MAG TPA: hypothetical protein DCR93_13050 [Cytophagales bacterium]|nr:hypothetical protein [Cytophagales bacterium]HAP60372.1 hypothetical protein [Cytophagales bacterium]
MRRQTVHRHSTWSRHSLVLMMTGVLVALFLGYSSQFPQLQENVVPKYRNVSIYTKNHSFSEIEPSVQVLIDGEKVCHRDSLSTMRVHCLDLFLSPGRHVVEVSTLDHQYTTVDTLVVANTFSAELWVEFHYQPPVTEYIAGMARFLVHRRNQEYSGRTKDSIYRAYVNTLTTEHELGAWDYQSGEPYFSVSLKPPRQMVIE